jgi:hypothetical protein
MSRTPAPANRIILPANSEDANCRMFPTWGEVLEVLQGLGYERTPDAGEDSAR